jgi:hypothetical protein
MMLLELPFISQIIALMPRDATPCSAIVRDKGVFEFHESEVDEFKLAAVMTERVGNRKAAKIYWKDGDFWAYFSGGIVGVEAAEAQVSKTDAFLWHWFATIIAPENFMFSHFPSGGFGHFHSQCETMPKRERIIENFRDHVMTQMQAAFAENVTIVDGSLMMKVREPGYQLYIQNEATKKSPSIVCKPVQEWLEAKLSRRLDKGHVFSALDWDGFTDAVKSFRKIAPTAHVSDATQKLEILMPEAFTAERLTPSVRSLACQAYRGMAARTIPEGHLKDYGQLYELFEHQASMPGIIDRLVDVMSRLVHLADLEDRLAWDLFLERYDNAPISIAF